MPQWKQYHIHPPLCAIDDLPLDLSEFCAGDAAVEAVSYTSTTVCRWRPAFRSDSFVCVHFVAVFYLQLFYSLTAALFIVYYALLCGFLEFQFTTLLYLSTRLELAAAQCFVPIHSFCLSVRPSVRPSVTELVNMIFCKRINWFWCKLAQW